MTTKKMLLLASAAFVVLGLTALPSLTGASATELWWYDDNNSKYPKTDDKKKVEPHGELSITQGGIRFGPCKNYKFHGTIWNEPAGMGEGTLETVTGPEQPCPTTRVNCTVLQATVEQLPWSLTLTAAKKVKVSGVKIQLHLSPGCTGPGVPTLTPIATGAPEGELIEASALTPTTVQFSSTPGLMMNGMAATLDGTLEFGTTITAKPEPKP